ncbi:MAG: DNA/RNA nuclease SfsA, partial [Gemmatimonadota bacterium]
EWSHGRSRFDFLLEGPRGTAPGDGPLPTRERPEPARLVLEVKSVTLVDDGVALFPDAVTARGARHVRELADIAARDGWEGAVLFVLQRPDADRIVAARGIDPDFADALEGARRAGVRLLGRRCTVTPDRVTLGARVDVAPG